MKTYTVLTPTGTVSSEKKAKWAGWRRGKIFGRLDCKSGKRRKKENRVFFLNMSDAFRCGYRPCKKCKPLENV